MTDEGVLLPCAEFREILVEAYKPCSNFSDPCRALRWNPAGGLVPWGFFGAVGEVHDVKLWVILAEPSEPESHQKGVLHAGMAPEAMLEQVATISFDHYKHGALVRKSHHENVRYLLNLCFGNRYPRFEDQLRLTWLCNSVLCCLPPGQREFPDGVERACVSLYLKKMAKLIPNAYVLPLGKWARERVKEAGITVHFRGKAYHPGGSHMEHNPKHRQKGLETYKQAAESFRKHMGWLELAK